MEVISANTELGAITPKEQTDMSKDPIVKQLVDSREDGVPELYAASDSGSMDSVDTGRASREEAPPAYTRAKSADNVKFSKSVTNNDLQFAKDLDDEGVKELLMFLQAPSSVILQSILEYQPTASFGFVKTHVHDGLSDDENPEYDADDMTAAIFPSKTVRYAAAGTAAVAGTTAVVAATRSANTQRDSMPAAVRHFTPDPDESKNQKAAAAATAAVVTSRQVSTRSEKLEEMDPQRAAMPAAVRHFTPDPTHKEEKVWEKQVAPIAVRHFTPDWETTLPPTIRESLDKMSPEEKEKWISRPIAVLHFTPKTEEFEKKEVEFKPYEMPIAMKHFAPEPKEKKEYVPEPMPAAMQHFTPDWEAEAAKKKAAMNVKHEMPAAVKHFTPEWEVFIPPTVRESLATMSPEERKRWAETPMAVSHFTPYDPPKEAYQPKEVPIAIQKFTPDPNEPKKPVELDWEAMPIATRHFTPDPNNKKVHEFEPAPAAVRHFTPNIDEIESARKAS